MNGIETAIRFGADMPPVITDPERFDVAIPAEDAPVDPMKCWEYRLSRLRSGRVQLLHGPPKHGCMSMRFDHDQLRWLRDRFNEILGEP